MVILTKVREILGAAHSEENENASILDFTVLCCLVAIHVVMLRRHLDMLQRRDRVQDNDVVVMNTVTALKQREWMVSGMESASRQEGWR